MQPVRGDGARLPLSTATPFYLSRVRLAAFRAKRMCPGTSWRRRCVYSCPQFPARHVAATLQFSRLRSGADIRRASPQPDLRIRALGPEPVGTEAGHVDKRRSLRLPCESGNPGDGAVPLWGNQRCDDRGLRHPPRERRSAHRLPSHAIAGCVVRHRVLSRTTAGRRARFGLNGRTRHRTIGTEHAAIALLRPQLRAAAGAHIKELAGVRWHRLRFGHAATRTGNK